MRTSRTTFPCVALLLAIVLGSAASADAATLYVSQTFQQPTTSGWASGNSACLTAAALGSTPTGSIPGCANDAYAVGGVTGTLPDPAGQGTLRLTNDNVNQAGYAIYSTSTSSTNGLVCTFTEYAYDGTGADGISLFFLDASKTSPTTFGPGAYGGSLGYAQRTSPTTVDGILGGYIGIGFDEYGNYSNPTEGRVGGPGAIANTVAIRGVGAGDAGTTDYAYLTGYNYNATNNTGSSLAIAIGDPTATTRGQVPLRTWRVTLTAKSGTVNPMIMVELDTGSGFTTIIPLTDVSKTNGTAFPANFYFGFASSTGNSTNIHEIVNVTLQSANAQYGVETGPVGNPYAVGSYDGVSATNDIDDFTERSILPAGFAPIYGAVSPAAGSQFATTASEPVPNQLVNTGNVADTYTLTATAPTGWTVQLFADKTYPAAGAGGASQVSSPGTALAGSTAGATTTATTVSVGAGQVLTYWATYTAPSGTKVFSRYDGPIVATSTTATAASNTTHDELYSGIITVQKSVSVTKTNCQAAQTVPATGLCPGGIMQYVLGYANIALGLTSTAVEPTSAILSTSPGTLKIAEDGAAGTNNWAAFTTGLQTVPVDSNTSSSFTYGSTNATTLTVGATSFNDTIGGTAGTLAPGGTGSITFSLTVK